jgi:hypothetical protein
LAADIRVSCSLRFFEITQLGPGAARGLIGFLRRVWPAAPLPRRMSTAAGWGGDDADRAGGPWRVDHRMGGQLAKWSADERQRASSPSSTQPQLTFAGLARR